MELGPREETCRRGRVVEHCKKQKKKSNYSNPDENPLLIVPFFLQTLLIVPNEPIVKLIPIVELWPS